MSRKHTVRTLLLSISVLSLGACGGGDQRSVKSPAPMPPIAEMDAAMNDPSPPPQPLTLSESDTLTPVMPVAATPATTTTVSTTTTSAAPSSALDARIAALEQSVGALRADYNRIMPAFASLNTTNERIQVLLDEMESEGKIPPGASLRPLSPAPTETTVVTKTTQTRAPGTVSVNPAASDMPVVETTQTVTETKTELPAAVAAPAAPAVPATNTVTAVRIGEHGSKTRIVFDLTAKTKPDFKYDIDNAEKVLLVEMPSSNWTGAQGGKPNSPLIAGWSAQQGATGGSTVAVQLKKDARILSTEFLKAEGKDPARLVMDIAAAK